MSGAGPSPRKLLKNAVRDAHRSQYWTGRDPADHACPMCGRDRGDYPGAYEVHHRDKDWLNGHDYNLVAICQPCHKRAHVLPRRTKHLAAWKEGFLALGGETA